MAFSADGSKLASIGMDRAKLEAEKEIFKKDILPQWLKEAKEREDKMEVKTVSMNK